MVAATIHDTHRCDRCGYEWEDDGGYYYGCPRCVRLGRSQAYREWLKDDMPLLTAEQCAGMSWDAMTPEEQGQVPELGPWPTLYSGCGRPWSKQRNMWSSPTREPRIQPRDYYLTGPWSPEPE